MRDRLLALLVAISLVLVACTGATATNRPAPSPDAALPPTPTRTPEPNLPAGTCVFTGHAAAVNKHGQKPQPTDPVIKGVNNESGQKIYFVPGMRRYPSIKVDESKGDRWFCREPQAEQAGWRASATPRDK